MDELLLAHKHAGNGLDGLLQILNCARASHVHGERLLAVHDVHRYHARLRHASWRRAGTGQLLVQAARTQVGRCNKEAQLTEADALGKKGGNAGVQDARADGRQGGWK